MKVTKRDFLLVAVVLVVLVVLITGTSHEKGKPAPIDDKHRPIYEAMEKGADRIAVERGCVICHNLQANPLPKKHPPKEECFICHKLQHAKQ
jgi:cbb3-type cytochrome oxidase cytochrome c subunit